MFNNRAKDDSQVKEDVTHQLRWDPSVNESAIKVTVTDGVATLRGNTPHFFDKTRAEEVTLCVGGVKAVANEIEVVLMNEYKKSDEEIAKAALEAIQWDYTVHRQNIQVAVSKGWITLRGETEWNFQRSAIEKAVSRLMGVVGVTNEITISEKSQSEDVKASIENALKRSAEVESRKIDVDVHGDRITLSGTVHSYWEVADAEIAAWSGAGVRNVENNLKIN